MSINIETDLEDDRQCVVIERLKYTSAILFRGTREQCLDYARSLVDARRDDEREGRS